MSGQGPRQHALAMASDVEASLRRHLVRSDGQEDVCFGLWRESSGSNRRTALLFDVVLPESDDRHVHGNASFEGRYFLRAAQVAADADAGLALLHSHPGALGWQGMSSDDDQAERIHAPKAGVLTGRPLIGLTLAGGDLAWSARRWEVLPDTHSPVPIDSVRVVGDQLRLTFNPQRASSAPIEPTLDRTVSAWGEAVQRTLSGLRVGVAGAGSVGAIVAEALVRMGVGSVAIFDFDRVEQVNLDRLLHATRIDARFMRPKVDVAAAAAREHRSSLHTEVEPIEFSVVEPEGFARLLDCDVVFSCVDRPWPRHVLNFVAFAHLLPVVDGGVSVHAGGGVMRGAEWRAHVAAPGRRCLVCLGQLDPALVGVERDGLLDDPQYIRELPDSHPAHRRENVFAFSLAAASAELLQFVSMVAAPAGVADIGAQLFHLATGGVDRDERSCDPGCPYPGLVAAGDQAGLSVVGPHAAADRARGLRRPSGWRAHAARMLRNAAGRLG